MSDGAFALFTAKLLPTVERSRIIGVRTPQLRALAREMLRDGSAQVFMEQLPHYYFEENLLHSLLLSQLKRPVGEVLALVDRFLPFVDNWAVCDQLRPRVFAGNASLVYPFVCKWMGSEGEYVRRYGIVASMTYFLDDDFNENMLRDVARVPSAEYYVMMAVAWYFSFALVKQWERALPYIEQRLLSREVHNKAIRKGVESLRISPERKDYLRSLRWKAG
ncbi:MAG: DNA alkylation repair protein [Bacteroidaceae bacterium]|nr:DNA alkylation repair protein [Bacteroidaceae bacterium]MBQ8542286.1 DNA alkylation repair protein [Bacteroidaceae bacterium]